MKVKVRKRKPAQVAEKQAIMQMLISSNPDLYSVVQKAIRDLERKKETLHQNKLNENDSCGNAPSYQFLTHDVGGRGHRKRRPAPIETEQASEAIYDIRNKVKNEYDVPNHLIVDDRKSFRIHNTLSNIDVERKMIKRLSTDRIPEHRFIEIIDRLHYKVHHPIVRNAKAKMYPNLTIQEYADFFEIYPLNNI
ncbi:MAG: hypothetical protein K2G60_00220 [Oscillospiraceae bacterium]|nr:hypothetical protein [Oscillospiraceae bacterium]